MTEQLIIGPAFSHVRTQIDQIDQIDHGKVTA